MEKRRTELVRMIPEGAMFRSRSVKNTALMSMQGRFSR